MNWDICNCNNLENEWLYPCAYCIEKEMDWRKPIECGFRIEDDFEDDIPYDTYQGSTCICGEIVWGNGLCPGCTRATDGLGLHRESTPWCGETEFSQEDGLASHWLASGCYGEDDLCLTVGLFFPVSDWNRRN